MPDRDAPSPLARIRADLAGPRGYRRVDALLSAPDPAAAVASLSPVEVYELVHEVGFDETAELIALTTPEQVRGCLDIEVWDRDRPLLEPIKPWLATILDAGFEKVGQVWAGLDPELRALYFQRNAEIYDHSLGEEPREDDERPIFTTTDRFFTLIFLGDEENQRLTQALIDDLYRADAPLARHTLMAARAEPAAELEDQAYRWRAGRMADLGFVDFYEALDLFQPLEPDQIHIGEGSEERFSAAIDGDGAPPRNLPSVIAEQVVSRGFLSRALDHLAADHADRIEQAILVLVNKVMSAARVKPGEVEALRRGALYATATVSLGLETISRGDLERAAQALATVSLTRLHRAGYTVAVKLARLAQSLAPRAATAGLPASAVIGGLTAARPWLARAVDIPAAPGVRPFESQVDVRKAAEVLAKLALRIAIVESLGVNLIAMGQAPEPRPALDDHARTALVRVMAGGAFSGDALTVEELTTFRRVALAGGELTDAARERGEAAVRERLAELQVGIGKELLPLLVADWLGDIERTLASIADDEIDPRFVEGVIAVGSRS
jgi:hypothetical protein